MSKSLKLASVRLKPDQKSYKETPIATPSDVAFLMGEEIATYNEDMIGVLNIKANGEIINLNMCTLDTIENDMANVIAASVLSNAGSIMTINNNRSERLDNIIHMLHKNCMMIGIPHIDHVICKRNIDNNFSEFLSYKRNDLIVENGNLEVYVSDQPSVELNRIDDDLKRLKIKTDNYIRSDNEVTKEAAIDIMAEELAYLDRERIAVISFKGDRPINANYISQGDLVSSICSPREVFKMPLLCGADKVILMHNHPSGKPKASQEDIVTTKRLCIVADIFGIEFQDHIIVGGLNKERFSFAEKNLLNEYDIKRIQPAFIIDKNKADSFEKKDIRIKDIER